jgi:hypothetical protein
MKLCGKQRCYIDRLRTFEWNSPVFLKDVSPKILKAKFFRHFFLENAMSFGVSRFLKLKSRHDLLFDQNPMNNLFISSIKIAHFWGGFTKNFI